MFGSEPQFEPDSGQGSKEIMEPNPRNRAYECATTMRVGIEVAGVD